MLNRRSTSVLAVALLALLGAVPAWSHDIITNNGVTVTVHVDPNDEPVATQPATIVIESVKTRMGVFTWKTCKCTLAVSDSSGKVLRQGPATQRTPIVFPEPSAYQLTFAGRVKRNGVWRTFKIVDALRADAP